EGAMLDVPDVERKLFVPIDGVPAVHLSPAGDARLNLMATHLFGTVPWQVLLQKRPRADETHLPPKHVDQLRKFIQACAAQEATDACQALGIRQQASVRVSGVGHRPELE